MKGHDWRLFESYRQRLGQTREPDPGSAGVVVLTGAAPSGPPARSFTEQAAEAATGERCGRLFEFVSTRFVGRDRYAAMFLLEQRLNQLAWPGAAPDPDNVRIALMRLRIWLRDYRAFLTLWNTAPPPQDKAWSRRFARLAVILQAERFPDHEAEKVFVIGLSKTGTTTLHAALEELSYLSSHFHNPFTQEILTAEDSFLLDALTDTPICPYFETLFHLFPNSRFILSTRPLDSWLESYDRHRTRHLRATGFDEFRRRLTTAPQNGYLLRPALSEVSLLCGHPDPLTARQAWEARVDAFFQGDRARRLLVFDAFSGDGWDKLCGFLGRDAPPTPFPWENRSPA